MVFWLLIMCKHDRAAVSCCGCIITYSFVWPNSKNQPIDSMLCRQSIKYWWWDGIIEVFQKSKNKLWYFIVDDVKYNNSDTFCISVPAWRLEDAILWTSREAPESGAASWTCSGWAQVGIRQSAKGEGGWHFQTERWICALLMYVE